MLNVSVEVKSDTIDVKWEWAPPPEGTVEQLEPTGYAHVL